MKLDLRDVCMIICIVGIFVMIVSSAYSIISTYNFCESKGYTYYHTATEDGYIACCKPIIEDHIEIDERICEAFEYNMIWW